MKILIISLLRLGDLVMISGIIKEFKNKGYIVDLLINREAQNAISILDGVNKHYIFDRELIQYAIGEQVVPLQLVQGHIKNLISEINHSYYDRVYNLTNTHLSAFFMWQIHSNEKVGLEYKDGKYFTSNHESLLRLNGLLNKNDKHSNHFIDVFSEACGFESQPPLLIENHVEISNQFELNKKYTYTVCLQPLTSDEKKNWGFENWKNLALNLLRHNVQIQILCSVKEYADVLLHFKDLVCDHLKICVLDLSGVLRALKNSNLLITGDTAIKHIASAVECTTIEIALGSSHIEETGVYLNNSLILTPTVDCFPCRHSDPCPHLKPICRQTINPEMILNVFKMVREQKVYQIDFENIFLVHTKDQFKLNKLDLNQGGNFEKAI